MGAGSPRAARCPGPGPRMQQHEQRHHGRRAEVRGRSQLTSARRNFEPHRRGTHRAARAPSTRAARPPSTWFAFASASTPGDRRPAYAHRRPRSDICACLSCRGRDLPLELPPAHMTAPAPAAPAVASAAAEWIGTWSRPADRPAQVAFFVGVALLAVAFTPGGPTWLASFMELATFADLGKRRRFLVLGSFAAAFLSLGYIAFYLRGGPRAPEAATYWLQGRAMSHGFLAWPCPEPSASFRTGGLIFRPPDRLSGTLPPGFPLLLAPAFLVGAPMPHRAVAPGDARPRDVASSPGKWRSLAAKPHARA